MEALRNLAGYLQDVTENFALRQAAAVPEQACSEAPKEETGEKKEPLEKEAVEESATKEEAAKKKEKKKAKKVKKDSEKADKSEKASSSKKKKKEDEPKEENKEPEEKEAVEGAEDSGIPERKKKTQEEIEREAQELLDRELRENPKAYHLGTLPVRGSAGQHFEKRDTRVRGTDRPAEPGYPPRHHGGRGRQEERQRSRSRRRGTKGSRWHQRGQERKEFWKAQRRWR